MLIHKPDHGIFITTPIANPAAGAEFGFLTPQGFRIRPIMLHFTFTTSATVANRMPILRLYFGAGTLAMLPNASVQTASTARYYTYGIGFPLTFVSTAGCALSPLPKDFWMEWGDDLVTTTALIDATDQYSSIFYTYEREIQP